MTKLKIDLKNGILEVEGEEEFVKALYQDFRGKVFDLIKFTPQLDGQQEKPNGSGRFQVSDERNRNEKKIR